MTEPGISEQRNAGHLLIGELAGGESERAERVRQWLGRAVELRVTGCLVEAPAELLGYHPRGSRGWPWQAAHDRNG